MGQQKVPGLDRLPAWDSKKGLVGTGCLHGTAKRAWSGQAACMGQQKEPGLDRLPAWNSKKSLVWTGCLHGTGKRAWSGQAACMGQQKGPGLDRLPAWAARVSVLKGLNPSKDFEGNKRILKQSVNFRLHSGF